MGEIYGDPKAGAYPRIGGGIGDDDILRGVNQQTAIGRMGGGINPPPASMPGRAGIGDIYRQQAPGVPQQFGGAPMPEQLALGSVTRKLPGTDPTTQGASVQSTAAPPPGSQYAGSGVYLNGQTPPAPPGALQGIGGGIGVPGVPQGNEGGLPGIQNGSGAPGAGGVPSWMGWAQPQGGQLPPGTGGFKPPWQGWAGPQHGGFNLRGLLGF